MSGAQCAETSISVGIEDIDANAWTEKVYTPDIIGKADTLYEKPGYGPL
jgi:4-oxalocrotonate tautomerase